MNTMEVLTRIQSSGLILQATGARLVVGGNQPLTEQQRQFIRQHKASLLKAMAATPSQPTATAGARSVAPKLEVTEPLPTRIEIPEPASKARLCYLCASFTRSPYGFPLGLCQQHGDRIQHSTSQPTRFGCDHFMLRQTGNDSRACTACRNYHPVSTMCRVVNTGCPYPAIPPCTGAHFLPKAVRS